jgi:hypothetical protein
MKTSAFARMALLTAALVLATSSVTMDAFARGHGGGGHSHGDSAAHSQSSAGSASDRGRTGPMSASRASTNRFPPGSGAGADTLNDWSPIW